MKKTFFVWIFILISIITFTFPNNLIVLFGNPHSHTSFSDGEPGNVPSDAYEYARDIANIDFLAVTDHAYYFEAKYKGRDKFEVMKEMANKETTNKFTALAGFEWTSGSGHINVFESKNWTSRNINTTTEDFYKWLINEKALAQFNHPISMFGTFKNFEYYPEADLYINMIEVGNGSWTKNDTINDEMFSNYIAALKMGWHVGATVGQDNHSANWGDANDSRTAIWTKSRNKKDILNAFFKRKSYGTEDKNVQIWLETSKAKMGDVFYYTKKPQEVSLNIYYTDPDKENVKTLEIYTPNHTYIYNNLPSNFKKEIKINVDSPYFYAFAKFIQDDGDKIVSSAIWYEPQDSIRIFSTPKNILYKNAKNPFKFYVYNISKESKEAHIKIFINDKLNFENTLVINGYSKTLINSILNTPNTNNVNLMLYINNILWYENVIELKNRIKIYSSGVEIGFLKDKYYLTSSIENSEVVIISSSLLKDETLFNKIQDFARSKKVGIVLDEINNTVLKLIPSKFEVTDKSFKNQKINNLYFNDGKIILYKGKERGFILNKNYVIFTGNPFENTKNELFIKKLLKLK
ncbi:phosphotransferase [Marinitoga sp. 1197]|uniref:CehA/McbA family metallohydrolase n=1 Tax=Marinitoga sp. 1197 TaxID=1428449 RepID=UPI000659D68F|nr:CehA/McbA family metallohydrolase [Marinitoga sp. 1197]KLO22802.1 phosphotransferase [Marinitoga sp. 1197]